MKEFKYTIKDELGIHARPAGLLVKEAAAFPCKVTIEKGGKEVKIATLHSKVLNKKYEHFWLRYLSESYCSFCNILGGYDVLFREEELDPINYIKPLSEV